MNIHDEGCYKCLSHDQTFAIIGRKCAQRFNSYVFSEIIDRHILTGVAHNVINIHYR
jgi:hypothetical protein